MHKICTLFFVFYCGYSTAAALSYKQISADAYQLILTNDVPIEIGQAQASIYSSAVQICKGRSPLFGKYSFESSEPIDKSSADSSFTFLQEISCTDEVAVAAAPNAPNAPTLSLIQQDAIKSSAKKMTDKFLSAKESGEFKKAYDLLGSGVKGITDFSAWEHKEFTYFSEELGKLISRSIWRVTLYNNPPNSPKPGLYIAADYENSYEKSPVHCGYIVWHLTTASSDDFSVMREEYGNITADVLKSIPKENLQPVRQQIGCRAL